MRAGAWARRPDRELYCMIRSLSSWALSLSSPVFPSQISEHYSHSHRSNQRYSVLRLTPYTSLASALASRSLKISILFVSSLKLSEICVETGLSGDNYWSKLGVYHSAESWLARNFFIWKVLSCISNSLWSIDQNFSEQTIQKNSLIWTNKTCWRCTGLYCQLPGWILISR